MPAIYQIHAQHGLKYVRIYGATNLGELRDLAQKYRDDPGFDPTHKQLVNMSDLREAKARFTDVLTLRNFYLRTFTPVQNPINVAIVAPTDLGYGIARMFTSLMFGQKLMRIKIFSDLTTAQSWLGGTFPTELTQP